MSFTFHNKKMLRQKPEQISLFSYQTTLNALCVTGFRSFCSTAAYAFLNSSILQSSSSASSAFSDSLGITLENIDKYLIADNTSFYSARHTFATIFINSEGAKTAELAQLMGRSVSGIDRYIKDRFLRLQKQLLLKIY